MELMVEVLQYTSTAAATNRSGGVLVVTPFSSGLVCDRLTVLVFDSHAHGQNGALLARVPVPQASAYMKYFFSKHYNQLCFSTEHGDRNAGHLTLLRL